LFFYCAANKNNARKLTKNLTNGWVNEAQENDSSDGANVVLLEKRESLCEHLVQAMAHTAQLRRKSVSKNTTI
jgi:hypothetical protein